jgi:hypothetical protein
MENSVPVKAFYSSNVLVGVIRSVPSGHSHIFFGLSGDGRELPRDEFWNRMKTLQTREVFVRRDKTNGSNGQKDWGCPAEIL